MLSPLYQVRVDSGIQEGSDISIYYDPMISKVSCCVLPQTAQHNHIALSNMFY